MWPRRVLMSCVVVVLMLVATGLTGSGRQQASIVASGEVQITMALDRLSALVSVDEELVGGADGIVDRAFLVQFQKPARVPFHGDATLVFTGTQLSVAPKTDRGLVFSLAGRGAETSAAVDDMTVIPAVGLSHYWGRLVEVSPKDLATKVLAQICEVATLGGRGQGCDSCEAGGGGEPACEVMCSDRTCSAECGEGYHACCSCSEGCRCCQDPIIQRPAGSPAPAGQR